MEEFCGFPTTAAMHYGIDPGAASIFWAHAGETQHRSRVRVRPVRFIEDTINQDRPTPTHNHSEANIDASHTTLVLGAITHFARSIPQISWQPKLSLRKLRRRFDMVAACLRLFRM